jgi:hypothetical protein
MGKFNLDILAKEYLRAVPVQAAATLGRPDFTIQDLNRLPHILRSTKLFAGYINHIYKTWTDKICLEEFAYSGYSAPEQKGVWRGRIRPHLKNLGMNYQDISPQSQTYHYKKGCTDS